MNTVVVVLQLTSRWSYIAVLWIVNDKTSSLHVLCVLWFARVKINFHQHLILPVDVRQWDFTSRAPAGRGGSVLLSIFVSGLKGGVSSHQTLPPPLLGLWGQTHVERQRLHAAMQPRQTRVEQGRGTSSTPFHPEWGDLPGPQPRPRAWEAGWRVHIE